ncbi:MAG: OmpA family protein [Bdellovibrionales bacterium]|nr:OmpA family protein [Bdellovibrionales bacterium]
MLVFFMFVLSLAQVQDAYAENKDAKKSSAVSQKFKIKDLPHEIEWSSVSAFSPKSEELHTQMKKDLDLVLERLAKLPENIHVLIDVYAKDFADPILNLNLSIARAMEIESYLVKKGIEKKRILFNGHGWDPSQGRDGVHVLLSPSQYKDRAPREL